MNFTWELPIEVIEEYLSWQFDTTQIPTVLGVEFDSNGDCLLIELSVDSADSDRIPESSSIGCRIV